MELPIYLLAIYRDPITNSVYNDRLGAHPVQVCQTDSKKYQFGDPGTRLPAALILFTCFVSHSSYMHLAICRGRFVAENTRSFLKQKTALRGMLTDLPELHVFFKNPAIVLNGMVERLEFMDY